MVNKKNTTNQTVIKAEKGKTFYNIINECYGDKIKNIAVCKMNGKYYELSDTIKKDGNIEIISFNTELGMKIYNRTLQFIFIKATLDLFPDAKIKIEHSINKGLFGEISKEKNLNEDDINKIKLRMNEIINKDIPIEKLKVSKEETLKIFNGYDMQDKIKLLEYCNLKEVNLYRLEERYDYFYGLMAYSTGIIRAFDLIYYESGFILRRPEYGNLDELVEYNDQKSLTNVFRETERWLKILGIECVGSLNEKIVKGEVRNVVMVSEGLHEKKIANIADQISKCNDIKIVLIAGPSSSGKTTFANRLSIQLRVNGLIPIPLSLDDYFLDRVDTPRDENGQYDYESIYALDLNLLNKDLIEILDGKEVEIPTYNFKTGAKEWNNKKVKLPKNGVLVIEGIHGLNPLLTKYLPDNKIFKIYISALTQLNIDNHNRISTTDVRKIRRIVRDSLSRGYGAEETLKMWPAIKKGEKNNIFIYQEEAQAMFNSTLVYELSVLKPYALKELEKITEESPVYAEGIRLKAFLNFFKEIDVNEVPNNSLLREFIGGSCFYEY